MKVGLFSTRRAPSHRTKKLPGAAATPVTHWDDRRATGNKSRGRVRFNDRFGLNHFI
ncbi:hypothetical protein FTUN_8076 [Frigoriglobus tundricola]|uniref:Uncharacterized protein n=1 Tax=Frigoriglobus tundricola TaxID=2774151 RepID=A0A6M5Z2Y8_9BACT|nr:hypothetical protein FTUN_8076 [Frigoriglobus tundricola]